MQIALGRKGDYAVRAVLDLAEHYEGERRKARDIAATMRVPLGFLAQILAELVREGIIVAAAGRNGGYRLARPPAAVSLLQVVQAAEGSIELERCPLRDALCGHRGQCAVHDAWAAGRSALEREFTETTFDTLARADRARHGTPAAAGSDG